jgi:hypothetical protein
MKMILKDTKHAGVEKVLVFYCFIIILCTSWGLSKHMCTNFDISQSVLHY